MQNVYLSQSRKKANLNNSRINQAFEMFNTNTTREVGNGLKLSQVSDKPHLGRISSDFDVPEDDIQDQVAKSTISVDNQLTHIKVDSN